MPGIQRDALKYDIEVDLGAENTSHRHMVEMIGSNKRVLDVGCSTGYLAKTLAGFGNRVTGIECDPVAAQAARAHAERVVVADLDQADLGSVVDGEVFDVVVFGDVLEHLRDPLPVLRQARHPLAPGGYVVISIPHVAHGDVRMSLMLGRFPYRSLGLLDSTHLRFFTRANLQSLLLGAGFAAIEIRTTTAPLFGTEIGVRADEIDPGGGHDDRVRPGRADLSVRADRRAARRDDARGRDGVAEPAAGHPQRRPAIGIWRT